MNFPNALKGVKKIYTSEILMLLAGVLGGVASFFATQAQQQMAQGGGTDGLDVGTAFAVMIPILAAGLIEIIATLIQFFGLKDAANDDEYFKQGYIYAFIGLVASIVFTVLSYTKIGGSMLNDLGSIVSNFIQIVVTFYVISGIKNLAEKLGNAEMVERGKKVFNIYAATIILSSVVQLAMTVLQDNMKMFVVGILGAVTIVLSIIGFVLYLGYLSKAKKMLA